MDASAILSNLGFRNDYRASTVASTEDDLNQLRKEVRSLKFEQPVTAIEKYLEKWKSQVSNGTFTEELAKIGFEFWKNGQNPLLVTIADKMQAIINKVLEQEKLSEDGQGSVDQKKKASARLSEYFKQVVLGHILLPTIKTLEYALPMVKKHPEAFFIHSISDDDLLQQVLLIQAIEKAGLNPTATIRAIEKERKLIENLKNGFESLQTPDRYRSAEDQINTIQARINAGGFGSYSMRTDLYAAGYKLSLRGEDPKVWELVAEYKNSLADDEYDVFDRSGRVIIEKIPLEKFNKLVDQVLEGFTAGYYLAFLEGIGKQKKPVVVPVTRTATIQRQPIAKIKWAGNNKQVYAMFRYLKTQGLIENTNDDLAELLKETFDNFENTAIGTIRAELGRDQDIPKARRIDHKKMLTSEDTP